jgi:apolipoprotein D and lipocalin family protein
MAASLRTGKTRALRRRIGLALVALACMAPAVALTPVTDFDLNRYYGNWYEIASIPGFLQSHCARDTQSQYTAADNGGIATRSHCLRADGSIESNEGRARPLDPSLPSVLKITTVHFLGIWWYPFGRESIVIAVSPDYRWLVNGHPSLHYGRILAREPSLSAEALQTISAALVKQGFDPCAFVFTPQTGGHAQGTRLCDDVH